MRKLIILSALIVCAVASWAPPSPANGHQHQHEAAHQHQREVVFGHKAGLARAERGAGGVSRRRDLRSGRGQLEMVQHGGGTVYHDKEFRRTKKGQHSKHREGDKGKNHLRRAHSGNKNLRH